MAPVSSSRATASELYSTRAWNSSVAACGPERRPGERCADALRRLPGMVEGQGSRGAGCHESNVPACTHPVEDIQLEGRLLMNGRPRPFGRSEEAARGRCLHRLRKDVTLPQLAPERDEALALRHRLDTLRDQSQPERPRQIHDRAHDVQVESTSPDAMHDRAVELDPLERKGRNRGERRAPGAEVVQVQLDAQLAQPIEQGG